MIKISLDELKSLPKEIFINKVLCFTTDTVWGVGMMVNSDLSKLYNLKKRMPNKPISVLAPNTSCFLEHVINNNLTEKLSLNWPNALTIIYLKKDDFFDKVTTLPSVGIRIPNCSITLDILNHLGMIATTSVNISNFPPINDPLKIEKHFSEYIDYLVTDTSNNTYKASTVIDATSNTYKVLRQGDFKLSE